MSCSIWREYASKDAIEHTLSIKQAVLKTFHDAFHAACDPGPGKSFWRKIPSPKGVKIRHSWTLLIPRSMGTHAEKSQYGGLFSMNKDGNNSCAISADDL